MANYGEQKCLALTASSDSSALRYIIVKYEAGGKFALATNNMSAHAFGVLQGTPEINEIESVCYDGKTKVVAGAALSDGAYFTHNTSGRAIAVISGAMVLGRALEAAVADGNIITSIVFPPFRWSGSV